MIEVLGESDRVIVEGVNLATKHLKMGQTQRGTQTAASSTTRRRSTSRTSRSSTPRPSSRPRVGVLVVDGKKERVFKPSRRTAKPVAKAGGEEGHHEEGRADC